MNSTTSYTIAAPQVSTSSRFEYEPQVLKDGMIMARGRVSANLWEALCAADAMREAILGRPSSVIRVDGEVGEQQDEWPPSGSSWQRDVEEDEMRHATDT